MNQETSVSSFCVMEECFRRLRVQKTERRGKCGRTAGMAGCYFFEIGGIVKMKQQEMYGIIRELNACGAGKEIIQIAKKDMENGVDGETVLWYGKSGWDAERIRIFSKVLKETKDKAFADFLRNGAFDGTRMELLFEFYKKGVPVEKMKGIMGQEMTPYQLRGILDSFCKKKVPNRLAWGICRSSKVQGYRKSRDRSMKR